MKFNMSNLNPPAWFYFDDDKPEDGSVLIRVCAGKDLERITRETSKKMPPEYKRGQRFVIPDKIDEKRHSELIWDFVIVDWKDLIDEKGNDIECTTANKVLLMKSSVIFAAFIGESLDKLNEDIEGYQKELEKNLSSSQSELGKNRTANAA